MGQKINPIIFRLGVNKTWKTEFFEKKSNELPLNVFKDLETRNYIERVLDNYGIILQDYRQHYSGSTLNLYISYFVTTDFVFDQKETKQNLTLRNNAGKEKIVKNLNDSRKNKILLLSTEKKFRSLQNSSRSYKLKQYIKLIPYTGFHQQFKYISLSIFETSTKLNNFKTNGIFSQIFKVLSLFNNNKLNIIFNFSCINKDLYFLKSLQEKTFVSLQKFRNASFFKGGSELLFHVAYNSNSANLLAKFIAFQLKRIKRQKFFLSFLKQSLVTLSTSRLSRIKGVKIIVKGRLNGVPRAKQKMLIIGDVPVQTISAKLDYSQTVMHNSSGSYGIQVWVVEK